MHEKYKLYLPIKKKLLDFATMSNDNKLLKKSQYVIISPLKSALE